MLVDNLRQGCAIEHIEYFARIGHLHGWRKGIFVAGHDIEARPLGRDGEFFA